MQQSLTMRSIRKLTPTWASCWHRSLTMSLEGSLKRSVNIRYF